MAAEDVLKNINAFVDGRGFAGKVSEFTEPKLTLQEEDYRAGGMDLPIGITMGMEKLTADITFMTYDRNVLALWGVKQGNSTAFTLLKALEDLDGNVTQVKYNMRGKISEIDSGTSKPGELPSLKVTLSLTYYKMTHGGQVVHEIDAERMIRVVNGTDMLAAIRAALQM